MTTRRAVITGGSSGLGLALAHALAKEGDELMLIARNPGKLESAVAEIRSKTVGAKVSCCSVDVGNTQALQEAINNIAEQSGTAVESTTKENIGI